MYLPYFYKYLCSMLLSLQKRVNHCAAA